MMNDRYVRNAPDNLILSYNNQSGFTGFSDVYIAIAGTDMHTSA